MTKYIFIVLIISAFVYDIVMFALADSRKNKPLPENVCDIYDADEYSRWRAYKAENTRLGAVESVFTFVVTLLLFATEVFSSVYYAFVGTFGGGEGVGGNIPASIVTLALYTVLISLLSIPFDYYGSMVIEEKYGFNRTTKKTFFLDFVKNLTVNLIINLGLYIIAVSLYRGMGKYFIIPVFAFLALFTLAVSALSLPMQKIFNKFTPLEDGELRASLAELFEKNGYTLGEVYVMDASRRTTKVNAFCTGIGKFKNIVLYDNLVNNYSPDEIKAVFAHELGHYRHKDTAKMTLYSLFMMLCLTFVISALVLIPAVSADYGFEVTNIMFALVSAMSVVMTPLMTLLNVPASVLGRRYEYRADRFAAENGCSDALISSLKKLTRDNMGDLNPHPAIVFLEHNHPTLSQRISAIERIKNDF